MSRLLQTCYTVYNQTNNQNLLNTDTGVNLGDAIKRYKLYLRKLTDNQQIESILYEKALNRFVPCMLNVAKPQSNMHSTINIDRTDLAVKGVIMASRPPLNGSANSTNPITHVISHSVNSVNSNNSNSKTVLNGSRRIEQTPSQSMKTDEQCDYTFEMVLKLLDDSYYMR